MTFERRSRKKLEKKEKHLGFLFCPCVIAVINRGMFLHLLGDAINVVLITRNDHLRISWADRLRHVRTDVAIAIFDPGMRYFIDSKRRNRCKLRTFNEFFPLTEIEWV